MGALTADPAIELAAPGEGPAPSPWVAAWRRLRRNRAAMGALAILVVTTLVCLCAPLYAQHVAHTDPFRSNPKGTVVVDGRERAVLETSTEGLGLGVTPIGPTLDPSAYFLGADNLGRDVAARVLYGGRTSLLIGAVAALLACVVGTAIGLAAGVAGGIVDTLLSLLLDLIWAFPVYLLAISLSSVLLQSGLDLGLVRIDGSSLLLPIAIVGGIFIPYVARPVRAQVLSLREQEFVHAGTVLGASTLRIVRKDVLPNILSSVIVFFPLIMAVAMLTEASLSFLSIGVQAPNASWGSIIQDGQGLLYSRPFVAIVPGAAIAITVLALNVLGDGVRDALDPRARLRGAP